MARDIHGQLKPAPYARLVEWTSQVIFDYLLCRADDFANFTVREHQVSIWISFAVSRSQGIIESLPGLESRDCQLHAFAPIPDCGTQKKRSQVLLCGARTNAQLAGDFLVAAALYQ